MVRSICIVFFVMSMSVITFAQTDSVSRGSRSGKIEGQSREQRVAAAFVPTNLHFDQTHMCSSSVIFENCEIPEFYTLEQPTFWHLFWSPISQSYTVHVLITDLSGVAWVYEFFIETNVPAGWYGMRYFPNISLANGDYIYTAIFAGNTDGSIGVSRQVLFSIR